MSAFANGFRCGAKRAWAELTVEQHEDERPFRGWDSERWGYEVGVHLAAVGCVLGVIGLLMGFIWLLDLVV